MTIKLAGAILQIVPVYNVEFMVAWFAKPRQRGLLFQGSFYPENYPRNYPRNYPQNYPENDEKGKKKSPEEQTKTP